MRSQKHSLAARVSQFAVRSACLAIAFSPAIRAEEKAAAPEATVDPAVAELINPTRQLEIGIGNVDDSSAKFGQYNGLGKNGLYGIGNLELSGGGAYDSDDATRWNFRGTDLGLETREIDADYGIQGIFRLSLGYDELLHNHSDEFQTPYQGLGSNNLTLPSTWLKPTVPQVNANNVNFRILSPTVGPAGSLTNPTPSPGQLASGQAIRNADLPAFHEFDINSKRRNYDGGFNYNLGRDWELTASYRHQTTDGTKLINAISTKSTFESSVLLADPVDTATDQFNLGINFTSKRGFFQAGYYGSLYRNHVKSVSWQDPSDLTVFSTQSSSSGPDNQFHQVNLVGGYNFSPSTRLVLNASYGRNTQNDAFIMDDQLPIGLPRASFDGEVVTTMVSAKFTARPLRDLNLAAAYRFDDRDNSSPVDTYVFYDINVPKGGTASSFNTALNLPAGTLASNVNIYANRPHSRTSHQFNLDADYVVARGHTLAAGYEFQRIDRECKGTWIACDDGLSNEEHTIHVEWRARLLDSLSGKIGYSYSMRDVNYNIDAWLALAPMANFTPGAPTVGATTSAYGFMQQTGVSGWGPNLGFPTTPLTGDAAIFTPNNNIITAILYGSRNQLAENPRMRRYNVADRDRGKFRSSLNWEPTEKLSFYGGVDFNDDNYTDSSLGLQNSKGWTTNLDSSYALRDATSISLFYTHEDQRAKQAGWNYVGNAAPAAGTITGGCFDTVAEKNQNNKIDPCNAWNVNTRDRADTIGLTVRDKSLLNGRLDLGANLVYTRAITGIAVQGGNYATVPGTTNLVYIPAYDLPDASTRILALQLTGQYEISKTSSVRLAYLFEQLTGADFAYDAAQFGTLTTGMPSLEHFPSYSQNLVAVSYLHRFR